MHGVMETTGMFRNSGVVNMSPADTHTDLAPQVVMLDPCQEVSIECWEQKSGCSGL